MLFCSVLVLQVNECSMLNGWLLVQCESGFWSDQPYLRERNFVPFASNLVNSTKISPFKVEHHKRQLQEATERLLVVQECTMTPLLLLPARLQGNITVSVVTIQYEETRCGILY